MRYKYTAYDQTGKRVDGTLEARSPQLAEDLLWQRDLIVTKVTRAWQLPSLRGLSRSLESVSDQQILDWARQLAILLTAGVGLVEALDALRGQRINPLLREATTDVVRTLREGGRFSDALAKHPKLFPNVFIRLIQIGEQTGELVTMLRRSADYTESQAATRSKIRSSLAYPALVAGTAGVSVYILLTFTIPMLTGLIEEFEAELPLVTRIVVAVGAFTQNWGGTIFGGTILLIVSLYLYRKRPQGKAHVDRMLLRAPLLGDMLRKSLVARATQTIATVMSSGVPLLESVRLTRDATEHSVMKQALTRIESDLLQGRGFSEALVSTEIFPSLMIEMCAVGERSGSLADQLAAASNIFQTELDRAISRVVGIIEPAMIIVVGAVVGIIGTTVITTVYSVLPQIGK